MHTPVDGVPIGYVLRSVHRHGVQLALRFGRLDQHQCSKAHLPTSAPFQAQPPGLLSGQLSAAVDGGADISPRFPAAFRPPAFASWASCPAEEFRSPHGRPTRRSPGPRRGFHVPHIRVTAGLGALFTPRPSGALATGPIPPATARPLSQGPGPITPVLIPSPELSITRRHQGFTRVHPPGLPPRLVVPPDGTGALRLTPRASHPKGKTCGARRSGGRASSTRPESHDRHRRTSYP